MTKIFNLTALGLTSIALAACGPALPPRTAAPASGKIELDMGDGGPKCLLTAFRVNRHDSVDDRSDLVYAARCPNQVSAVPNQDAKQSSTVTTTIPAQPKVPAKIMVTIDGVEYVRK